MGRAPCCDKASVKRGPWSPEEDVVLKSYVEKHGTGGNWIALPQKAGLKRCGKSCRLRWLNYLRPDIKHGGFTEEEDDIICSLYKSIGSRWSVIASQLPGRTDNDVKNRWNTKLKKRLLMAGGQPGAITNSGRRTHIRRSPPPSPPTGGHGHGSSISAHNASSSSTLISSADEHSISIFGFSELASVVPADALQPSTPFQDTSAASSSLAIDYDSGYDPWFDNGLVGADAFLMHVGMAPMEFPSAGGYGLGELGDGEAGVATTLWGNAQTNPHELYQSVMYSQQSHTPRRKQGHISN